jgi:DNA-binding NarL/FixJ family response regulator
VSPGDAPVRVVAFVDDLLDRSRVATALPDVAFVRDPAAVGAADVVLVDVGTHGRELPEVRAASPRARIVAFGRHTDTEALDAARRAGADLVWPRSRFFRDPAAALAADV